MYQRLELGGEIDPPFIQANYNIGLISGFLVSTGHFEKLREWMNPQGGPDDSPYFSKTIELRYKNSELSFYLEVDGPNHCGFGWDLPGKESFYNINLVNGFNPICDHVKIIYSENFIYLNFSENDQGGFAIFKMNNGFFGMTSHGSGMEIANGTVIATEYIYYPSFYETTSDGKNIYFPVWLDSGNNLPNIYLHPDGLPSLDDTVYLDQHGKYCGRVNDGYMICRED